jgi:hypothetical protein
MTDRAVQPEAPTTEAGRELDRYLTHYATVLGTDQEHHLDLRVHDRLILAIEAEAYRQGWDANTATSFGNRAASQERPQPQTTEERAAALGARLQADRRHDHHDEHHQHHRHGDCPRCYPQERPQPPLHGHQVNGDWYECTDEHLGVAQERPSIDVERFAWDVWECVIDTLQPQFTKAGEGEKWGKALRAFIVARLAGGSVASPEPGE